MELFQLLDAYLDKANFSISVVKKGEKITVGLIPKAKTDTTLEIIPLVATETAAELDKNFPLLLQRAFAGTEEAPGLLDNLASFVAKNQKTVTTPAKASPASTAGVKAPKELTEAEKKAAAEKAEKEEKRRLEEEEKKKYIDPKQLKGDELKAWNAISYKFGQVQQTTDEDMVNFQEKQCRKEGERIKSQADKVDATITKIFAPLREKLAKIKENAAREETSGLFATASEGLVATPPTKPISLARDADPAEEEEEVEELETIDEDEDEKLALMEAEVDERLAEGDEPTPSLPF